MVLAGVSYTHIGRQLKLRPKNRTMKWPCTISHPAHRRIPQAPDAAQAQPAYTNGSLSNPARAIPKNAAPHIWEDVGAAMRILIADDQDQVRFALRVLLKKQPGLQVVAETRDGAASLAQIRDAAPDLILLDWELPGLAEAGGLPALRLACAGLQVVVLSSRTGVRKLALAAGADAFVSKGDPPERLLAVIRRCGAPAE